MSNNYSEERIIIFSEQEDRDVWATQCIIAKSSSPSDSSVYEGFEIIGTRCLRIWHNGNINTVIHSKILKIISQITQRQPELNWVGSHHVEGNEYCFDIRINNTNLSFDSFPIMMSDSDDDKLICYKAWITDIRKVITNNVSHDLEIFSTKMFVQTHIFHLCHMFVMTQELIKYAKTDDQIISFYLFMIEIMKDINQVYSQYELISQ